MSKCALLKGGRLANTCRREAPAVPESTPCPGKPPPAPESHPLSRKAPPAPETPPQPGWPAGALPGDTKWTALANLAGRGCDPSRATQHPRDKGVRKRLSSKFCPRPCPARWPQRLLLGNEAASSCLQEHARPKGAPDWNCLSVSTTRHWSSPGERLLSRNRLKSHQLTCLRAFLSSS